MTTRRRGFTLIEVLTVIGIIILLVGITVYGISKVMGGTKVRATETTLTQLKGMLSEYEVVSKGLKRQPQMQWLNDGDAGTYSIWQDFDPGDGGTGAEPDPAPAPRDVTLAAGTGPRGRYTADQIGNTQIVLAMMQQVPAVRTMISQLPAQQLMEQVPGSLPGPPTGVKLQVQAANGNIGPYNGTAGRPAPPLILDAWGNPIIFVPGGGLCGSDTAGPDAMYVGGKPGDSDAKMVVALGPNQQPGANQVQQIRSPDNRPFWASAGADGNFLTGDDNIYSFESH